MKNYKAGKIEASELQNILKNSLENKLDTWVNNHKLAVIVSIKVLLGLIAGAALALSHFTASFDEALEHTLAITIMVYAIKNYFNPNIYKD